jgi:hypothetical protein
MSEYRIDFVQEKIKNSMQKTAYSLCDMCHVDPLECGSRYGNLRRCRILNEKMDKLFEDPTHPSE